MENLNISVSFQSIVVEGKIIVHRIQVKVKGSRYRPGCGPEGG